MTSEVLSTAIATVVCKANFGKPSAAKRGRWKDLPYVPIVDYGPQKIGVHATRTKQLIGLAFATRAEAVASAESYIARERAMLAQHLAEPRYRALRLQYGLPQELEDRNV
jgi:hypothetical protein